MGISEAITQAIVVTRVLQLTRLVVLTLIVGGGSWSVALAARPEAVSGVSPEAQEQRRGAMVSRSASALSQTIPVSVEIDGLRLAVSGNQGESVAGLFRTLGVSLDKADRLSVAPETAIVPGLVVSLNRGLPVTLIDGGQAQQGRGPRGSVQEFLDARGVALGPLDEVDQPLDGPVSPETVIKITRVSEREHVEDGVLRFAVRSIPDPAMELGRQELVTPGVDGQARRTWTVRTVDGIEVSRALVAEAETKAAVTEVRRFGSKPRPAPPAPAEIERIIREAAAAWGADPEQLLRVAYCESRFNPNAFNPTNNDSGLFQFIPGTWAANSPRAGYAGASPFDPVAASNTAAMMFAAGQARQWTCK